MAFDTETPDKQLVKEFIHKVTGNESMKEVLKLAVDEEEDTGVFYGVQVIAEHLIAKENINAAELLSRIEKEHASEGSSFNKFIIYCCVGIDLLGVCFIGMRAYRKQKMHKEKNVDRAKKEIFLKVSTSDDNNKNEI